MPKVSRSAVLFTVRTKAKPSLNRPTASRSIQEMFFKNFVLSQKYRRSLSDFSFRDSFRKYIPIDALLRNVLCLSLSLSLPCLLVCVCLYLCGGGGGGSHPCLTREERGREIAPEGFALRGCFHLRHLRGRGGVKKPNETSF